MRQEGWEVLPPGDSPPSPGFAQALQKQQKVIASGEAAIGD